MLKGPINILNSPRWAGLRIGLFGGSFNPPHQGHLDLSRTALRMLGLDCVWWMVTPANPLKKGTAYEPLASRLHECELLVENDPRLLVCNLEGEREFYRTFDTLTFLKKHFRQTDFVFLMGTDSASNFHHWHRWQEIPTLMPLGIIPRPPAPALVKNMPLGMVRRCRHIHVSRPFFGDLRTETCFWMHHHPLNNQSSTLLRKRI